MSITLPFGISASAIWIAIGFLGQAMFFMRFFVQWIASEKEGKSIIPQSFWYFSIAGSLILLAYAIWRQDPVIILGQSTGFIIYFRNLYLIKRTQKTSLPEIDHPTHP
ncbi:MAG: lipid-A-disaccharide synthase N-terminal domain-containing protein [Alphaproteobacteria bacterium]|nr:lipid-A-disaccharide synthase N-terminal domain-containing protein [Alphaproteobacteria bacterium]